MTEYVEEDDSYEDDPSIYDMLEEQEEVAEINAAIQELQTWHGSRFSHDEVQRLGELIDAGHNAEEAYQAVAPETDQTREYANAVEQLERDEGRTLSEPEQERVWQSVQHGTEEVELHDLDSREGRQQWAAERLNETFEQPEPPETVEPLSADASPAERRAWMQARVEGAEVENTYADYGITETGEPLE